MLDYGALVLDKICIGYKIVGEAVSVSEIDFRTHPDWIEIRDMSYLLQIR